MEGEGEMVNYLWIGMVLCALVAGAVNGTLPAVGQAAMDAASQAVTLSIGLAGGYALWLGLMRVADAAGLQKGLGELLKKPIAWLCPEARSAKSREAISMNLTANMLGLGNAATPLGLEAMRELEACSPMKKRATDAMCMLLVINASSIQLVPTSLIALRQSAGSANPAEIVLPALLATTVSTAVGILAAKLMQRWV